MAGLRVFHLDNGWGLVHCDRHGMDIVIHVNGNKIEIKEVDDLRFEMSVGDRPLRVHVLADRAKIVG